MLFYVIAAVCVLFLREHDFYSLGTQVLFSLCLFEYPSFCSSVGRVGGGGDDDDGGACSSTSL